MLELLKTYWPALPFGFFLGVAEKYWDWSQWISIAALAVFSISYATYVVFVRKER